MWKTLCSYIVVVPHVFSATKTENANASSKESDTGLAAPPQQLHLMLVSSTLQVIEAVEFEAEPIPALHKASKKNVTRHNQQSPDSQHQHAHAGSKNATHSFHHSKVQARSVPHKRNQSSSASKNQQAPTNATHDKHVHVEVNLRVEESNSANQAHPPHETQSKQNQAEAHSHTNHSHSKQHAGRNVTKQNHKQTAKRTNATQLEKPKHAASKSNAKKTSIKKSTNQASMKNATEANKHNKAASDDIAFFNSVFSALSTNDSHSDASTPNEKRSVEIHLNFSKTEHVAVKANITRPGNTSHTTAIHSPSSTAQTSNMSASLNIDIHLHSQHNNRSRNESGSHAHKISTGTRKHSAHHHLHHQQEAHKKNLHFRIEINYAPHPCSMDMAINIGKVCAAELNALHAMYKSYHHNQNRSVKTSDKHRIDVCLDGKPWSDFLHCYCSKCKSLFVVRNLWDSQQWLAMWKSQNCTTFDGNHEMCQWNSNHRRQTASSVSFDVDSAFKNAWNEQMIEMKSNKRRRKKTKTVSTEKDIVELKELDAAQLEQMKQVEAMMEEDDDSASFMLKINPLTFMWTLFLAVLISVLSLFFVYR